MRSTIVAGALGLLVGILGSTAHAQFEPPMGALSFEDTGTFEGTQQSLMQFRDSKTEAWLLELSPHTKVSVKGDAEPECLRPGVHVQLTAKLDKKGMLAEPVEAVEIFTPQGKGGLGVFAEGDPDGRPVRSVTAGTYHIKAKIASLGRDGSLTLMAGSRKILGSVGDELKVTVTLDDPSLGQVGDSVKAKVWYYDNGKPNPTLQRIGKGLAEEVTITLAKPLANVGKKKKSKAVE